ncbi:MAG TPA: hypothetical protein VHU90_11165 [Galbitalea sp.]|nr:hypothetical protein [Galbitalea sp.]
MRWGTVVAVTAVLVLCGCAAATLKTMPTLTQSMSSLDCPPASVKVATAPQLRAALTHASPGDVITLANGTYTGAFTATARGSADHPIYLCGGREAVLQGRGVDSGYVLHLDGATNWRLLGFSVRNGKKGIMADGVQRVAIGGLSVSHIGDEAIHLRRASSDNLVFRNTVSSTGLREPKFGEGIYVGSAKSNWCGISNCQPDRSDRNRIVGNDISATTAEAIDIKEGTSHGEISSNRFDGSKISAADSWVDVKGNDWLIADNVGTTSPKDGFQTHEVVSGWGRGNRFSGNHAQVDGPGEGFVFEPPLNNILDCSNTVSGAAGGFANVKCTR